MEDIKDAILNKAKERFDRFGYKKTTMDELSRDCKISKKTIYELFKDKENLFHCLFLRECHEAQAIIFARTENISDPVERLKQLLRTAVKYFSEDNFLTRLLKDEDALFSAILSKKYRNQVEEYLIEVLAGIIRDGKSRGVIRDVDEEIVAYAGLNLFRAFSFMKTSEFSPGKENQGYYVEALLDFIMNGLVKK